MGGEEDPHFEWNRAILGQVLGQHEPLRLSLCGCHALHFQNDQK